ncbi:Integrin alpha-2 [Larimichthys crocea]|uniref:Uncharacterized protein n=1 Tax=Larimichthys crocea TaxID=215358 RepID=A0ACD3Q897_LARCR|nr:Integrin alpha-2 [Larimichthys crocea]
MHTTHRCWSRTPATSTTLPSSLLQMESNVPSTQTQTVTCQVGYPALKKDEEMKFQINFDYNFEQLQNQAVVKFEAKSDGKEERPADNKVDLSIPIQYDSGVVLSRQSNINFYCGRHRHSSGNNSENSR